MGTRPYVWMLSGCLWFSVMGVLAHDLGNEVNWQVVALARSGLATVFAFVAALVVGTRFAILKPGILWMRSISGSCSMLATFYALTRLPVSEVLTITNTFPIWVALLSWPMAGERPTLGVWVAVICSVGGVALAQQPHVAGFPPAAWAALAASGFTAVAMLGLNRLHSISSLAVVVHFSAVSTVFCAASFLLFDLTSAEEHVEDPWVLARLFGVGATATVGQVFLTRAFRKVPPTRVAVVGLSQVVMVMGIEFLFGRRFEWSMIAGTALVLGPTAWVMLKARKPVEDVAIE